MAEGGLKVTRKGAIGGRGSGGLRFTALQGGLLVMPFSFPFSVFFDLSMLSIFLATLHLYHSFSLLLYLFFSPVSLSPCLIFLFPIWYPLSLSFCPPSCRRPSRGTPSLGCSSALPLPASGTQLQLERLLGARSLPQRPGACLRMKLGQLGQRE